MTEIIIIIMCDSSIVYERILDNRLITSVLSYTVALPLFEPSNICHMTGIYDVLQEDSRVLLTFARKILLKGTPMLYFVFKKVFLRIANSVADYTIYDNRT